MRPWYCAQTHPQKEPHARDELERQGFTVFMPSFLVKDNHKHILARRLFAGYLFVSLDDWRLWPQVKNTYFIAGMMTHQPEGSDYRMPNAIASDAIEKLRVLALSMDEVQRGGKERAKAPAQQIITAGCLVRIKTGPLVVFNIQQPVVDWTDGQRAALLLAMFGREMRIEFFVHELELVNA
jgi:transcription antitermination factor NusG